jgi:1,4-alpha-glucan branching enzyme
MRRVAVMKEKNKTAKRKGTGTGTVVRRRVTFSLNAPGAQEVFVTGDFNGWKQKAHPMKRSADGIWKKIVMLPPGRYEYRYLVDEAWSNDPTGQICPNCFGSDNNFTIVP